MVNAESGGELEVGAVEQACRPLQVSGRATQAAMAAGRTAEPQCADPGSV